MADSGRSDNPAPSIGTPPVANERTAETLPEAHTGVGDAADGGASETDGDYALRRPSPIALLADLERRVRQLESRVDALEGSRGPSRRLVKTSDMVRWGLWLVVIAFLAYYWLRMGARP